MSRATWISIIATATGAGLGVTYALVWGCDSG